MRQKPTTHVGSTEQVVKDIRRATRKQYSAEEKIRIVLDGLREGEYHGVDLQAVQLFSCRSRFSARSFQPSSRKACTAQSDRDHWTFPH